MRKFWKYSDYPLSLGVSEFCSYNVNGEEVEADSLSFPFAVILKPCLAAENTAAIPDSESAFDNFLERILNVPENTVLFELFACPDPYDVPDPSKLQRIGRVVSTSTMFPSVPNDGLFFKHQKKEDDYNLRPSWRQALQAKISIDDGQIKGTVGQLAGWKLFEQHISQEQYVDFERK